MAVASFNQSLLSELLRPQHLGELAIPKSIIRGLEAAISRNNLPNMLFYGAPGAGKTSAAKIIAAHFDSYMINGSDQRKERSTIAGIEQFAATVSLANKGKLCLIDEADYLPKESQAVLRGLIEKYSSNCRFLMTANDKSKLTDPIKSRMLPVSFAIPVNQRGEVLDTYTNHLLKKLTALGHSVDKDWLIGRVLLHFPDFRAIANDIEFNILCNR